MIKRLKNSKVFKSTILYTLSALINAAIPFLLIPFLTDRFSPENYGKIAMAAIAINILTPLIGFSAHGAIHRRYFDNHPNFPRYIGNAFFLLLISSLIILIIILVFKSILIDLLVIPLNVLFYIYFIAIGQFITMIALVVWQARNEPIPYAIFQILLSISNLGMTFILICSYNMNWEARILAQLLSIVLFSIIAIVAILKEKNIILEFNKEDIKDILNFSLPLIPHTLGGLAIAFTDRFLISKMIGISETGLYTLAFQIGSILNILNNSFINAYVPWFYSKLNQDSESEKIRLVKITYLYFCIQLLIVLIGVIAMPILFKIFIPNSYQSSSILSFGILLGYAFNGMYLMIAGFIFYVKKTSYLSKLTFAIALFNIPICTFFIKQFGTIGASYSMSLIYFITFITTWYISQKCYKMPWFKFS